MKMVSMLSFFSLLVSVHTSFSQPIPNEVKSVVGFVFIKNNRGELSANGTGFFVGVSDTTRAQHFAVYFVTAKHVLKVKNREDYFESVYLRLNRLTGDAQFVKIDLIIKGQRRNVFVHQDTTVDIAVIPALPDQEIFDFKFLPDELISTRNSFEQLSIREGSEIFFTGLFIPHIGEHRNYPVVRFGRVALLTDERIDWEGQKTNLYLVESTSFGGNSGSPVFFYLGAEREPGKLFVGDPVLRLAGIMKGYFGESSPIQVIETQKAPVAISNIGISGVVPAYLLHEILFSKELRALRGF